MKVSSKCLYMEYGPIWTKLRIHLTKTIILEIIWLKFEPIRPEYKLSTKFGTIVTKTGPAPKILSKSTQYVTIFWPK